MHRTRLTLNTTILFVTASVAEMMLHEGGHFAAGLLLHMQPVLHHNYVSHEAKGSIPSSGIWFASAGPLVSLVLGIMSLLLLRTGLPKGFARLFLWYFSISGFLGFFGYLVIAPFFEYGDTGYVLRALSCPMWAISMLAVTGLAALVMCIFWLAPFPVSLMSTATAEIKRERGRFILALTVFTLLIGVPLLALLNLPSFTLLSLLAPLMSPWSILYAYGYYLKGKPFQNEFDHTERVAGKMPIVWYLVCAGVLVVNLLLVPGYGG